MEFICHAVIHKYEFMKLSMEILSQAIIRAAYENFENLDDFKIMSNCSKLTYKKFYDTYRHFHGDFSYN